MFSPKSLNVQLVAIASCYMICQYDKVPVSVVFVTPFQVGCP